MKNGGRDKRHTGLEYGGRRNAQYRGEDYGQGAHWRGPSREQ